MTSGVFHGGGIAEAAKHYGRPAEAWLDLSTGINPVSVALPEIAPGLWHRLPDSDLTTAAREAAARYYESGSVLPVASAGTQPLIRIAAGIVDKTRRVAILSPTYGEYRAVFASAGFAVDEIGDLSEVHRDHGVVVVVNPNNPDGRVYSRADLLALALQLSRQGAMLIVDEAFADLTPAISLASEVQHNPHLLVLRSVGKFFGLAGMRLSFAVAGSLYQEALEAEIGPWPVSGPALEIARHIFAGDHAEIRSQIHAANAAMRGVLQSVSLNVAGDGGLFLLVRDDDARGLHAHLCRHGILTRAFDYRADWLRFGLCADEEALERLSYALRERAR